MKVIQALNKFENMQSSELLCMVQESNIEVPDDAPPPGDDDNYTKMPKSPFKSKAEIDEHEDE